MLTQEDLDWQESVAEAKYTMRELEAQGARGFDSLERFAKDVRRCKSIIAADAKLRALRLSPEERGALEVLRSYIVERDGEYVLDLRGDVLPRATRVLDRLLAGVRK